MHEFRPANSLHQSHSHLIIQNTLKQVTLTGIRQSTLDDLLFQTFLFSMPGILKEVSIDCSKGSATGDISKVIPVQTRPLIR
jgi:hypothetical protein